MKTYRLPIRLASTANLREHWAKRAKRAKAHRKAALVIDKHPLPCVVTIIRCGSRPMDSDNLAISAKHIRDGIADRLGVDDADPRIEWRYDQESGDNETIVMIEPKQAEATG